MNILLRLSACCLIVGALCAAEAGKTATGDLDRARITADAGRLIAIPDRSMGSAGAEQAARFIADELKAAGLEPLRVRTTVAVAVDLGSTLTVDGAAITLTPHRPNRAATAGTGGVALNGPLLFLGKGRPADMAGKTIAGTIVVLDGDSDNAWVKVAELGAQAVVFRNGAGIDVPQLVQQSVAVSLELPRFIADLDPALNGHQASLTSTVRWEPRTAWSIAARISGTGDHSAAVMLTAGYESPADLVGRSPGATRAWNAALLLELSRSLATAPTTRDVVVVFAGARAELMRGLRHLTAGLTLDRGAEGFAGTGQLQILRDAAALQFWRETSMRDGFAKAAAKQVSSIAEIKALAVEGLVEAPVAADAKAQTDLTRQRVEDFLGLQAGTRADLMFVPLNQQRNAIGPRKRGSMSTEEVARRQQQILDEDAVYQRYLNIQRKLAYAKPLDADEEKLVAQLILDALPNLERHLAIIAASRDDYDSLIAARSLLGGASLIHLIGLDFSDGAEKFSSNTRGTLVAWEEELGWLHSGLVKMATDLNQQANAEKISFEPAARDDQSGTDAWFGTHVHEAGCAGLFVPAASLSTVSDARLKVGSPSDTAQAFSSERFLGQTRGLRRFVNAYIDADFLAGRKSRGLVSKAPRVKVEVRSIGTKTGKRGYPYPLIFTLYPPTPSGEAGQLGRLKPAIGDVGWMESSWGDTFGICNVPFLSENNPANPGSGLPYAAYGFTDKGRIAAVLADSGQQAGSPDYRFANAQLTDQLPLVFSCVSSQLFGIFDPRLLSPLSTVIVYSANRDAAPDFAHVEMSREHGVAALFSEQDVPLRVTATQGQVGNRMVITGHAATLRSDPEAFAVKSMTDPDELGPGMGAGRLSPLTALDAAVDMWNLNDIRLLNLRHNGISSDSLVNLHSLAERELAKARADLQDRNWDKANAAAQTAWALSGRVYPSVLSTANDVVKGLVVMLLFAIPFAWICERLFLSGSTIVRKLVGFVTFFIVTFLFFYYFHPAFALSNSPMIIFLAFVIIILSTWVIALIYNKFEHEMEAIRMEGLGMHKADVSRLGTLFATVSLGISNMRRRPLRTFLTAVTVVLMTFILLTFASFTPSIGSQRISLNAAPAYRGILVRQNGWLELPDQALARIERARVDRFHLHQVRWLAPTIKIPRFPLAGPAGITGIGGVIGVGNGDPTGIEDALRRGPGEDAPRGFGEERDWIFLAPSVLKRLGIEPGQTMLFKGLTMRAGVLDPGRLGQLNQLGGDPLTPLMVGITDQNEVDEDARLAAQAGDGSPTGESGSSIHLSPTATGVIHVDVAKRLGGTLRAIALLPTANNTGEVAIEAEDLARQFALTLLVGDESECYLLTSVGRITIAGLGAVLIPLILGGLIIFSTMLNSVAERGKDIFIYASLGLAPIHVATLFLVEASIYAVLGGLGGYMLAQFIVSALGMAADMGYGVRPDLNYSSFTAVATILLVMATVLISALYPALMASKAANPGTIDFRVPDAKGDLLEIAFPFTVSRRDVRGLCAFLTKYFDSNTEAAGGCFTSAEAAMSTDDDHCEVTAKVWLSPFDLGISQRFTMRAVPTDVKAIYSVQLRLELLSGQRAAWKRTNLAFLKDLRQQFLVWRTLSPETMEQYRIDGGDKSAAQRVAVAAPSPAGAT